MYALIHNNQLILGPMKFNVRYFNEELEDLEIDYNVTSNSVSQVPLHIDDVTHIIPVREEVPEHDPKFSKLLSFSWSIVRDENEVPIELLLTYPIANKTLDEVKEEIKQYLKPERQRRENSTINVEIGQNTVQVSTSRESRLDYISKFMSSSGPHNFKFSNDIWLEVENQHLENIIREIDSYVQQQYDWELNKINEIDSCTTIEEVYNVEIFPKVEINPRTIRDE
jgi:hypothetical protein